MNFAKVLSVVFVVVAGLMVACESAPSWWDMLSGSEYSRPSGGYGYGGYDWPQQTGYRQPKSSGNERYKKLCRVLNPDNYAFPGNIPYPAAPLCPY